MRHAFLLSFSLALPLLAFATNARADDAPPSPPPAVAESPAATDEIVLKNGGLLRGTIVELEPGKSVVILVAGSNERRALTWEQVESVHRGAASAPSAAPKAKPAPPIALPPVPAVRLERGLVTLHIASDNEQVQLHRYMGTAVRGYTATPAGPVASVITMSELLCRAPCDQVVDGRNGEEFFFTGKGVTKSSRFQLIDKSGPLHADVRAGSQPLRTLSYVTLGLGAAATTFGLLFYALATGYVKDFGPGGQFPDPALYEDWKSTRTTSIFVSVGGLVALAGSIAMIVASSTGYDFAPPATR